MELNPLPDLLNTRFTFTEIVLFYGKRKYADSWRYLALSFQDGHFWSVPTWERRRVKTLQILVEFF